MSDIVNHEYDYSKEWAEIAASELQWKKELQEKKDKFKEQLRPLLDVDTVWAFLDDNEVWEPEGSIDVEIIKQEPNGRHIAIDLSDKKRPFTRQDEYIEEAGVDHVYCWQTEGYSGDDYSGWLLFPLSNGRYFRVSFQC